MKKTSKRTITETVEQPESGTARAVASASHRGQGAAPRHEAPRSETAGTQPQVSATGESASQGPSPGGMDPGQPNPPAEPESIELLTAKVQRLEASLLRAKADFQNLQRQSAKERENAVLYGNESLMKSLLGVLDDFERSLESTAERDDLASFSEGIRLVHANFRKALLDHGLEPIEALHKPFDPSVHAALTQQPTNDHPPNTVMTEVAKGYRLRDRVIRPARVVVSKAVESPDDCKEP